jgi:hypothetical protein
MKKILLFFKTYTYEIIALTINITVALISLLTATITIAIGVTVFLLSVSTFVIIYLRTKEKEFYFLPMDGPGKERHWIGSGKFGYVVNEKCYEITESNTGYILPSTLNWSDYRFEFNFKIINNCIAWIVRANNLSNYLMFQCSIEGINPHIRLNGEWIIKRHFDKDTSLTFNEKLNQDTWYRAKITCEKRNIRIAICNGKKNIFDRHWKIPSQLLMSYKKSSNPNDRELINILQNIDFDFGAIGFRDSGDERGLLKNIYLEKL